MAKCHTDKLCQSCCTPQGEVRSIDSSSRGFMFDLLPTGDVRWGWGINGGQQSGGWKTEQYITSRLKAKGGGRVHYLYFMSVLDHQLSWNLSPSSSCRWLLQDLLSSSGPSGDSESFFLFVPLYFFFFACVKLNFFLGFQGATEIRSCMFESDILIITSRLITSHLISPHFINPSHLTS